jgi:hypothetical protein
MHILRSEFTLQILLEIPLFTKNLRTVSTGLHLKTFHKDETLD